MESTLFVAVSCLLLHLGHQSRIRKAVSVLVYPPTLYLRPCVRSLLDGVELKDYCTNGRFLWNWYLLNSVLLTWIEASRCGVGAGDRLLCSRVSESCDVVGYLHLFIFVKKSFETKAAVRRSGSGVYRTVQRLTESVWLGLG